ncbi:hypothetical protein [Algoriphagus ratkowskyi]|uniref:hypothetical protein n=1 Tax=Algoriphagus ratkowskyi TaxID=57028 RepID=UPI001177F6BF|nr:hypothetical protein [Algoriphagus ratkowskyi]
METAMKLVTNFAIEYEIRLKENLSKLGSFRTDFSYFDKEEIEGNQLKTEIPQWNIFDVSLGTEIKKSRNSLTLGLVISFECTQEYFQRGCFSSSESDNILEGALVLTRVGYSNFILLVVIHLSLKIQLTNYEKNHTTYISPCSRHTRAKGSSDYCKSRLNH